MTEQGEYTIIRAGNEYNAEVYAKYLHNLRSGRSAFAEGKQHEFKGYDTDHINGISLRAFLREQDNIQIAQRVTKPLFKLAKTYGIELLIADDLWTPHVTIADLRHEPNSARSREESFKLMADNPATKFAENSLIGTPITFDVLWPGNAITLAASVLPNKILQARKDMQVVGEGMSMGMKDVANIVHITAARTGKKNNIQYNRSTNAFGREILNIHHGLIREPILAQIERADVMSNEEFMAKHEKKLFESINL